MKPLLKVLGRVIKGIVFFFLTAMAIPLIAVSGVVLAAGFGHSKAELLMGEAYMYGLFITPNDHEAFRWMVSASYHGDRIAQSKLGVLYAEGRGVPKNAAAAERLWRDGAKAGCAESQYNLGVMYERGEDIPQNYVSAKAWYRSAAAQGNRYAIASVERLNRMGLGEPPVPRPAPQSPPSSHIFYLPAESSPIPSSGGLSHMAFSDPPLPRGLHVAPPVVPPNLFIYSYSLTGSSDALTPQSDATHHNKQHEEMLSFNDEESYEAAAHQAFASGDLKFCGLLANERASRNCRYVQGEYAEKLLNDTYTQIKSVLPTRRQRALRKDEIHWIKWRETECTKEAKDVEECWHGCGIPDLELAFCKTREAYSRTAVLKSKWVQKGASKNSSRQHLNE